MDNVEGFYDKYAGFKADYYPVKHKPKKLSEIQIKLKNEYRLKIREIMQMDQKIGNFLLTSSDYFDLVSEAHALNVHWTTKIEGNTLSLNDVRRTSHQILESDTIVESNDPGPGQEILNHLYSYFFKDYMRIPWNLSIIKMVHKMLMTGTGEECDPGEIRESGETVCVYSHELKMDTFTACPSTHVKRELQNLLMWVNESPLDSILTAVIFFHEYESIHPFIEGNGRTGRTLFHILMQEFGYANFNLCKLEDKLVGNSAVYYSLMEYTDEKGDYVPLIEFFIDCIYQAYAEAVSEYSVRDALKGFDDSTRSIAVNARSKNDWFSISEAANWAPGLTEQSVRLKLSALVDKKILEKEGQTRSTKFRYLDPFRTISENIKKKYDGDTAVDSE